MSVNVASFASRGRQVFNQQTVLHVLRLVHTHYAPILRPRTTSDSPFVRSRIDTCASGSSRRYGNARAIQHEEEHGEDAVHLDEPPIPYDEPSAVASSSDHRDIPPDLLRFVQQDHNCLLPFSFAGDTIDPLPCRQLYADIASKRYKRSDDLLHSPFDPIALASLGTLRSVLALFERRSATEEQWIWLARQMAEMYRLINDARSTVDLRLSPLVHLVTAYALTKSSSGRHPRCLPGRAMLVRKLLDKAATARRRLGHRSTPAALESTLAAVIHASMDDWDAAKQSMFGAFTKAQLEEPYHSADLRYLNTYHDMLQQHGNGRYNDFYDIIMKKADAIVNALNKEEEGIVQSELQKALFRLLRGTEEADKWFAALVRREGREAGVQGSGAGSGVSEDPYHSKARPSKATRAMGSLLFMALSGVSERLDETHRILRLLFAHGTWLPVYSVADHMDCLTAAGRQNLVLEAYNRVARSHTAWTAPLLRRYVQILLLNDLAMEADDLHAELVAIPSATARDRTMVAFHYAKKGNSDAVETNLQRTFGSEWLKVVDSLAMMLEVWLVRGTQGKIKRFIKAISNLAQTQTAHLNFLLNHYANTGQVKEGLMLFNKFLDRRDVNRPDLDTFSALMRLFSRQGDSRNVDRIVQGAVESGLPLDGPFCAHIMEAGIRSQDWSTVARRWVAFPPEIKSHPAVSAALMKTFVYLATPFDFVRSFFATIEKPTRHHWHMVILSACDAKRMMEAERLLLTLERLSLHDFKAPRPGEYIYATVIHGYLRLNQVDHAQQMFNRMIARKLVPTGVTFGMILDSFERNYSARNTVEQAYRFAVTVFERAQREPMSDMAPSTRAAKFSIYARLIRMSAARGMRRRVDSLYYKAIKGRKPTIAMQTTLMAAYERLGHTLSAMRLWPQMLDTANEVIGTGVSPHFHPVPQSNVLCEPLVMVLRMAGDAGKHEEVLSIWTSVQRGGYGLDAASYHSYATALAKVGNLDGALHVLEQTLIPRMEETEMKKETVYGRVEGLDKLTAEEAGHDDGDGVATTEATSEEGTSSVKDASAATTSEEAPAERATVAKPAKTAPVVATQSPSSAVVTAGDGSSSAKSSQPDAEPVKPVKGAESTASPGFSLQSLPANRYLPEGYRPSPSLVKAPYLSDTDPSRPSEVRPEGRSVLQQTPLSVESSVPVNSETITKDVLEKWRPGDRGWTPSKPLQNLLITMLNQLKLQARQSLAAIGRPEVNKEKGQIIGPVYIREDKDVPLRHRTGRVLCELPHDIWVDYRQRYPRAMTLLNVSRRERNTEGMKEQRHAGYISRWSTAYKIPKSSSGAYSSPWRDLGKWQAWVGASPDQWVDLNKRAESRRMTKIAQFKGRWGLKVPKKKKMPRLTIAMLRKEKVVGKRREMIEEYNRRRKQAEGLARSRVVRSERERAERGSLIPGRFGDDVERTKRELRETRGKKGEKKGTKGAKKMLVRKKKDNAKEPSRGVDEVPLEKEEERGDGQLEAPKSDAMSSRIDPDVQTHRAAEVVADPPIGQVEGQGPVVAALRAVGGVPPEKPAKSPRQKKGRGKVQQRETDRLKGGEMDAVNDWLSKGRL